MAKRLNRTFYGIEIVHEHEGLPARARLNRTFYGIEIIVFVFVVVVVTVLIVPFMELKCVSWSRCPSFLYVLIVPFMELKSGSVEGEIDGLLGLNRTFYGIEIL